jgi:acetylornithine deacetylase/succinyl-diaminopimelate desuccinylase-like protein
MKIQKQIGVILVLIVLNGVVQAQVSQVRSYTEAHRAELTGRFRDFLSIPNVAADPSGLKHNADFLLSALRERGVEARLLTVAGAPPVVYGEIRTPNAEHTIVLYAHYDGQPVTPAEWEIPPLSRRCEQ